MGPHTQPAALSARAPKHRLLVVLGMVAYVACFQWMYVNYLYPYWDYFGFDYNAPGSGYAALAWLLAVAPSLWMPMKLARPSQLACWVLYIAVYIPSMFVPLYAGLNSPSEIRSLMLTLLAGFALIGSSYLLPLPRPRSAGTSHPFVWKAFACLAAGMSLWMFVVFRHHLQVVSFLDVYDVRDAANDVAEGGLVSFTFMTLTGAVNPFLMACGLYLKRPALFVAGAAGQLLIFAVGGTKGSILSIFFIVAIAVLLKPAQSSFGLRFSMASLALLGSACLSYRLSGYNPGPLHTLALFVVLMRTLSINGLLTAQYYNFFQANPLTYFSHVKGVNWFLHYPYKYSLGQEIGVAYAGTPDVDASAHFWATDGIGGLGLPGILLMSLLCAFVFWALDCASQNHDPRFGALVTTYAAYNIANISLFTSLFSGGFALLILLLYLMPPQSLQRGELHRSPSLLVLPRAGLKAQLNAARS